MSNVKFNSNPLTIAIIGGGAAGFFGAIACAEANPNNRVILLEKARQVLSKVRVSGGGRCNVTHACFEPALLVQNYPRGSKVLRGPFSVFQPRNTIDWFKERGVTLKTEADGRMFPTTDSSETIIHCLLTEAQRCGVEIKRECGVKSLLKMNDKFVITVSNGDVIECDRILIATGSANGTYEWLKSLGHTICPPVPSLFTFNIPNSPLHELAGISVNPVALKIDGTTLQQKGPFLITHWGFSGPAVLKLSAWGAKELHEKQYRAVLRVDWLPEINQEQLKHELVNNRNQNPNRKISSEVLFSLPKNLWKSFLTLSGIDLESRWGVLSNDRIHQLIQTLKNNVYQIEGKTTFKEEFVTCGGVNLDEINFKTMESKRCPGLYFAGEVLDIDGVTGGFNFQSAWTTSWIAGRSMAKPVQIVD